VVDRDAMLDAAERVIARDGSGASLEAIAEEAGVTKPIVYERVGSRAELSNALAERLADRLIAAASASADPAQPLGRDALAELFCRILETTGEHRSLFLFVTRDTANDAAERTLFLAARSARPLADVLAKWRNDRNRDPAVAEPWAYGIVGMLNLATLWWMEEGDLPAATLAGQLADLVWSGLDGA
jgi:AcrR family transcriptional regulator